MLPDNLTYAEELQVEQARRKHGSQAAMALAEKFRRQHEANRLRKGEDATTARAASRKDLLRFTEETHPKYIAGMFHRIVANALMWTVASIKEGVPRRLSIQAPPRVGKSELIGNRLPTWALGHIPDIQIIYISYEENLALSASRASRELAGEQFVLETFPTLIPKPKRSSDHGRYRRNDVSRVSEWKTPEGGQMLARSVGGGVTGRGADLLILDDMFKGPNDAWSKRIRDERMAWIESVAGTRLSPRASIISVGTRWHLDEPIARLIHRGGWNVLRFPALAERDEWVDVGNGRELFRRTGESIHPERYPTAYYEAIRDGDPNTPEDRRRGISPGIWSAVYQQNPTPDSGGVIDPSDLREHDMQGIVIGWKYYLTSDGAKSPNEKADANVIQCWSVKDGVWALRDRWSARCAINGYMDGAKMMWARWGSAVEATGGMFLVENESVNGPALLQLGPAAGIGCLVPFNPRADTPGKDASKTARWQYAQRISENARLLIPKREYAPWIDEVTLEWQLGLAGKNDDELDAFANLAVRLEAGATLDLESYLSAARNIFG